MITNVEEFKEVIEGNYGIKDLPTYEEYKKKTGARGLTKAEVELLSPDNVNSCSFWEYIAKNPEIAKDAVAFGVTKEKSIVDVNKQNYGLACSLGALQFIMLYKDEIGMPILDIGAGYGMLKEFVQQNTKLSYWGVDVYPKIEGVQQVASDGSTLPPNIMASKFGLIVACNVFQHLSLKQRRHYYEQVAQILYPNFGIFTVTHSSERPNSVRKSFKCAEDGQGYVCHYGQYTPVQSVQEIEGDLLKHFNIISICQRPFDDSFTFHCSRREQPPATTHIPTLDEAPKS
jgi:SAM-dependent methyltransferase